MAGDEIRPKAHPSLNLPQSNSTVDVSIINTTTDIVVPAKAFVEPVQNGHEYMNSELPFPNKYLFWGLGTFSSCNGGKLTSNSFSADLRLSS